MADPKILNETDTTATIQTVDGSPLTVPKSSPWYQELMDRMSKTFGGGAVSPMGMTATAADTPAVVQELNTIPDDSHYTTQVVQGEPLAPAVPAAPEAPRPDPTAQLMAAPKPQSNPMMTETQTSKVSKSEGAKVRPEDEAKVKEATDRFHQASLAEADAKIAANEVDAGLMQKEADRLADENQKEMLRKDTQQIEIGKRIEDINSKINELDSMKVDPNRLYGDMSTGNKIASSVALFLGAFGAGATGKDNLALGVLNKAIDRDIDAQKTDISTKKDVITAKRGAYDDFMKMLGNEDAAKAAEQARLTQIASNRMKAIQETTKNPIIKANAEQAIAQLDMQFAQKMAEVQKVVESNVVTKTTETKPLGSGKSKEFVGNPVQEKLTNLTNGIQYLRELRAIGEKNKGKLGPISGRITAWKDTLGIANADEAEMSQRILMAIAEKTKAISGAATTDAEFERLSKTVGNLKDNPEAFFRKLDNETAKFEREYDNIFKSYEGKQELPNRVIQTTSERNAEEAGKVTRK